MATHPTTQGSRRRFARLRFPPLLRCSPLPRQSHSWRPAFVSVVWVVGLFVLLTGCSLGSSSAPRVILPSPTPTVVTPEMQAAAMVSQMSLDDKLGQMIIMQFYEPTYTANQKAMVVPWHPGGVILYDYSMGTAQQEKALLAAGQKDSPIPMFTLLDMEGGTVDRLYTRGYLPHRMSATDMEQAAVANPDVPQQQGAKAATDLTSFEFNLDLAPDVDVALHYSNILWSRTFCDPKTYCSTPDTVIKDAGGWLQGLQGNGVAGCLKHFPGIGAIAATQNPHTLLPTIDRTKDQLEATEFAPFRALIQSGQAQCIMSTDVLVPDLDKTYPAELSKSIITGILRNELHYNGVAITDALYMDGISNTWSFTQASVLAIEAGNDMVMAPWRPSMISGIINGLKTALTKGDLTQAQIDASVTRILALKIRYHILTPPGSAPATPAKPTVPATTTPSADVPRAVAGA